MEQHVDTSSKCFSLPVTDLDTFLRSDVRDSRSGLPLGVCSLLLRYLLPQLEVERYVFHRRIPIEKAQKVISGGLDGCYCLIHVTGSSIEGFSVPPYREKTSAGASDESLGRAGAPFYQASDIDCMTEVRFLPVEVRPTRGRLHIDESRASHVGYVRIMLDTPTDTYGLSFPVRDLCRAVDEGSKTVYYLSNEAVKAPLAKITQDNAEMADFKVNLSGPAVNMEPKHSGRRGLDQIPDIDIVTALPLVGHPPAFHQWLERVSRRAAHWPRRETVEEIRRHGRCFVVTTGHASSADRDIECRLSFSDPERRLAQTVTPVQRKVYLLVKLLQKCYLKEPKVVVTYHLKTLMFWLLEESEQKDWAEKTVFERVLRFLEKIEGCLKRREIPSYFYPSNNLISHASSDHVATTLANVRRIRNDPLRYLHGIDERVWMGFSTLISLSSLHRRAMEGIREDKNDIRLRMAGGLMRQARQGTMRNILWPLRCADLLRDTYCLLREVMSAQLGDGASGAEDAVVWSYNDWLVLATVAVFAALRQEERLWVLKVSEGFELPREDINCEGDPFMEIVTLMLPGRPHAAFMLKMFLAADSGTRAPLDPRITSKYTVLVQKEIIRAAQELGKGQRPAAMEHKQESSTASLREGFCSLSTEASGRAEQASTGAVSRSFPPGARPKDVSKVMRRSETTMTTPAPDLPALLTESVMPLSELQNVGITAAAAYGGAPPVEAPPERLTGDLLFRETYGLCPPLVAQLHVSIVNIIGQLLRRRPRLACRCVFWLHQLTLRFGGWGPEAAPSVPLTDAPQFLQFLPPTSAALLRRPSARAALLPLSAFVTFTAVLADKPFGRQVAQMEIGEAKLRCFDAELQFGSGDDCAYDDILWTSVVMKLCVREMMGQDVARCLRDVGLVRGGDKGQRARQILARHRL